MGNVYGYVRVSSIDQNEDRQLIVMDENTISEDGKTVSAKLTHFSKFAVCKLGTSDSANTDVSPETTEQSTESNNNLWIIIAIVAVVLIAGAVVTVIVVRKKKNKE